MADRIRKYNPAFLPKEELVRSFVVRQTELELIVQTIRENTAKSNQHILVIGPRGIGKTMLVLRVAEEVRKDKDLSKKWYPLIFAEESYPVITPGEFWLEAIFHLAHQTREKRWNEVYEDLKTEQDEVRLRERALAQLMDFADADGKRILLVVENFNMLLNQLSADDAWVLRDTLLHEPRIMLLASATSQLRWEKTGSLKNEIENLEKAMFELFKLYELKPLNEAECGILWSSITGRNFSGEQIKPLRILTGGSPRLLAIISSFTARLSLRELMDDLLNLVDENTEYFKSHLESLPSIERKVYLALAELWDPSSSRKVAKVARLDVSKTSSLLLRLIERGAVVEVKGTGRSKMYQVAERMYNIYYLMRRQGAPLIRVRRIVWFMVNFYEPEELIKATKMIAQEACKLEPAFRKDHYDFYETILDSKLSPKLRNKLIKATQEDFFRMPDLPLSIKHKAEETKALEVSKKVTKLVEQAQTCEKENKLKEAECIYRKAIKEAPNNALVLAIFGEFLEYKLERYEEAEKIYREAIKRKPKEAWGWAGLGRILSTHLKRYEEGVAALSKAVELKKDYHGVWELFGSVLYRKLGRYDEAENAFKKAIELKNNCKSVWEDFGDLLFERERYDEAEKAYRKAIELNPDYWAWAHLGRLLSEGFNRTSEAEEAYRKSIELKPDYAWGWAHLGQLLYELDRYDESEKSYRKAIELDSKAAWTWEHLGLLLHKLKRYEEAIKAYQKVFELEPNYNPCPRVYLSNVYIELGRYEDAEKELRIVIEQHKKCSWARTILGDVQSHLEHYEEAEKNYRQAIELGPKDHSAWKRFIQLLIKTGRATEALHLAEDCLAKYPKEPELLNTFAYELFRHGQQALAKAEIWAREAVAIKPNVAYREHTLAFILCASGKESEALEHAHKYLEDIKTVENTVNDGIELFVEFAARGYAKNALEILQDSPSAKILEPLVVGLRLFIGEDVQVATEIVEIGKDVAERIQKRQKEIQEIKPQHRSGG